MAQKTIYRATVLKGVVHVIGTHEPYNEHGGSGVIINAASVAAYEGQISLFVWCGTLVAIVGKFILAITSLSLGVII